MDPIKIVCYGDSVENLRLTSIYQVIGVPRRVPFLKNEMVYFALKSKGEWNICGRAKVQDETDINPFGQYYTYEIHEFEACTPFTINAKCREYLGAYWGLIFQKPAAIRNPDFISFIEKTFSPISTENMLSTLTLVDN